jgi:NAD(P)-dependent dehydrogenase (short-subunit alcohol dehydrogenase family)
MSRTSREVAIITGGSQGIGASLVAAYRRQGRCVVATVCTIKPTEDPDVLSVGLILGRFPDAQALPLPFVPEHMDHGSRRWRRL